MESNSSPTPSTSSPGSVNSRSEDVPASSGTFVPDPYPFVVWRMPLSHPAPGSLLRTVLRRDSSSASNWLSTPWRGGWAPGRLLEPDRLSATPTGRPDSPDVGYSSPASGRNPDFDDYFWDSDNPRSDPPSPRRDPEEAYNHIQEQRDAARQSSTAGPSRIRELVYRHQDSDSDSDATVENRPGPSSAVPDVLADSVILPHGDAALPVITSVYSEAVNPEPPCESSSSSESELERITLVSSTSRRRKVETWVRFVSYRPRLADCESDSESESEEEKRFRRNRRGKKMKKQQKKK